MKKNTYSFHTSGKLAGLVLTLLSYSLLGFASSEPSNKGNLIEELKLLPSTNGGNPIDLNPSSLVHWEAKKSSSYEDGSVVVYVQLSTENDFAIYADQLSFSTNAGLILKKTISPASQEVQDPVTGKTVAVFSTGDFILHFQGAKAFSASELPLSIRYLACSSRICLFPFTENIKTANYPSKEALPAELTAQSTIEADHGSLAKAALTVTDNTTLEEKLAERLNLGNLGLAMILMALFLGGLLTNLTPCVYPMIPITIRLLGQQTKRPMIAGLAYAGGLVVIYTLLGLSFGFTGTLFGQYMADATVNIVLATIMFFLGFSMLGFGQWQFLVRLGVKLGISRPSTTQAFFMGCGAGLVASPCTGPILATILAYVVSSKDVPRSVLYLLTYSLGFALPYVFIGALAGRLAAIKIPAKVQVLVKVAFAAVMFALSFYYLRIPLYSSFSLLGANWRPICTVSFLIGLLLWRTIWRRERHHTLKWFLILPALCLGLSIFAASQWLAKAQTLRNPEAHLNWLTNESEALQLAQEKKATVLIDFWAEWCAACKRMDATTFIDENFVSEVYKQNLILLKLDVTEDSEEHDKILKRYKVQGLPTIIILKPGADQPTIVSGYASAARLLNHVNE